MNRQRVGLPVPLRGASAQKESQPRQRKGAFRTRNDEDFGPGGEAVRSKPERKDLTVILTSTSLDPAQMMAKAAWTLELADLDPVSG